MTTTAALCNTYKIKLLADQAGDVFKIALYTSAAATLNKSTTAYTATGEITATGYTAGGQVLAGFNATLDVDTAILDWTTDPVWPSSTIAADTALIYNSTRANKALAVFKFTSQSSSSGLFTVSLPPPVAATAIIFIA